MTLTYERERWEVISSFAEKDAVKSAGFRWDANQKRWFTNVPDIARSFEQLANETAKAALDGVASKIEASRSASVAHGANIPAPDGKRYFPYQQAGIHFALQHSGVLIGDEMGLGKTVQAIGVINAEKPKTVLVVCPSSLKINWRKELERWLTEPYRIHVLQGKDQFPTIPEIVIMNYDILAKFQKQIRALEWDLLIADEAHYMKNPKAQRTISLLGKGKEVSPLKAKRKILLTGTPITNRPIEIFPLVSYLWPNVFNNLFYFAKRYCAAQQDGYGWDFTGASNLGELQNMLRANGMIRRLKADVLKELPPKTRQVVALPSESVGAIIRKEGELFKKQEKEVKRLQIAMKEAKSQKDENTYRSAVQNLRQAYNVAFTEMAAVRKELAIAKIPFVIEYVEGMIEEGQKVVVMAHHRDVVNKLQDHFGLKAVKLYGGMPEVEKSNNVDRFQQDPSCMVFIGSIHAAGVGITLTAAQNMLFAELDWTPANMLQAEDRIHRIGQAGNALIQQLVFDGSLDAKMADTLVRKMAVIEKALDKMGAAELEEPIDIFE